MREKFLKPYNPTETESRIYNKWEESGFFNPDNMPERHQEPFSIVLPPPNVTGTLHLGHAFEHALEDIVVRYQRMRGKRVLWLPGTDHAAIATQAKVEKILEKEGVKKKDLGREAFLERVQQFAKDSHDTIVSQVRRLGASLDWSREAFTLDDARRRAVNTAFKKLYDLGLIYRGVKVVNWDPKGQTVISDDEVVHEERGGMLYTFKYWPDFPIAIATTRPETKLGDVAVAVHPEDARYAQYVGKTYAGNFAGVYLEIQIIADNSVDMEFGTGGVGITPMHSQTDTLIAEKHTLEGKQIIDEFARMMIPPYEGLKTLEAREKVIAWLRANDLLEKEEKTTLNISLAERTSGVIEPLPKNQWFVAVDKPIAERGNKTLKDLMREPVERGEITIGPDRFEKIYFHWIANLRDWCISRQIWYGHRIPVYYRGEELHVGEAPQGEGWVQDEDTLDTWFSSGLWTFSTLGWPEETSDLKTFHPTSLMISGYEILFFWVARMILMSQTLLGTIPFRQVYIHGIVRDKKGQKFSKSAGNGVDPVEVIDKYGADSLRMALIVGVGPGADSKYDEDKVSAYRKFSNKLWNITRYVLSAHPDEIPVGVGAPVERVKPQEFRQAELLEEFDNFAKEVTEDMENYRFDIAAEKLYAYLWHRFADEIIEESKGKPEYASTLYYILENSLKLLHPFMPFITEEIWQELGKENLLMIEPWPHD